MLKLKDAKVAVFVDYKGLSSNDMNILRAQVRAKGGEVRVIKNNVARVVVAGGKFGAEAKDVMDSVVGATLVAFGYEDAAGTAKIVHQFAKDKESLKIKDGLMGNKLLAADAVALLASLPSRDVMLSMVLSAMQGPSRGFVSVLAAVPRSLLNVLNAFGEKKSGSESSESSI